MFACYNFSQYNEHKNPILLSLKLLRLQHIFDYQMLKLIHGFIAQKLLLTLNAFFKYVQDVSSYETRCTSKNILYKPAIKSTHYGLKSIYF